MERGQSAHASYGRSGFATAQNLNFQTAAGYQAYTDGVQNALGVHFTDFPCVEKPAYLKQDMARCDRAFGRLHLQIFRLDAFVYVVWRGIKTGTVLDISAGAYSEAQKILGEIKGGCVAV